jgi:hypothetical protein
LEFVQENEPGLFARSDALNADPRKCRFCSNRGRNFLIYLGVLVIIPSAATV